MNNEVKSPFGFTKDILPIEGKSYYIDEKQNGPQTIIIVKNVYGKIFCRVEDPTTGQDWDTMCYRLTELKKDGEN